MRSAGGSCVARTHGTYRTVVKYCTILSGGVPRNAGMGDHSLATSMASTREGGVGGRKEVR